MARIEPLSVCGDTAPGYEPVKQAFIENFTRRGELGAACAAYHAGKKVVDLWGGVRDAQTGALWEEDTLAIVSSTTKGMTAFAVTLALSRGYLELSQPVAVYWPEFAQNGKERITVWQLMAHQAGLYALDAPVTFEQAQDLDRLAAILARQRPAHEPGARQAYHAITFGWYAAELLRRVDPQHRSLGRFFSDEIARPLGLDFYIGLPAEIPDEKVAVIREFGLIDILRDMRSMPANIRLQFFKPSSAFKRAFAFPTSTQGNERQRKRAFLSIEGPAYNGVGAARSLAKAYDVLATGAAELGLTPASLAAVMVAAPPPTRSKTDLVTGLEMPFSLGFCKPFEGYRFGGDRAFGMPGLGGSFAFGDPDAPSAFAYIPNKWRFRLHDDPRQVALWQAFLQCTKNFTTADGSSAHRAKNSQ